MTELKIIARRHSAALERGAARAERTATATRTPSETHEGAQIDQTERDGRRVTVRNQAVDRQPQFWIITRPCPGRRHADRARKQANDVRIEQRPSLAESQEQYGVGYVPADTRKREQFRLLARHLAAEPLSQNASEVRQPSAPVRESEWPQNVHDFVRPRSRERPRIGIALEKPLIRDRDEIGPGPLQQQLSDQHLIGVPGATPRKVSPIPREPAADATPKPCDIGRRNGSGHPSSLGLRVPAVAFNGRRMDR